MWQRGPSTSVRAIDSLSLIAAIACAITLATINSPTAWAKKPNWPGFGGRQIGFGLVELTPKKNEDNKHVRTLFTFEYTVSAEHAEWLDGGVVSVFRAAAARTHQRIPPSEMLAYVTGRSEKDNGEIYVAARVTIDQPGLYMVCYGPEYGILIPQKEGDVYKISVKSDGGIKWIDQDAGDVVQLELAQVPKLRRKGLSGTYTWIQFLRDRKGLLEKERYAYDKFELHPDTLDVVKLIDAHW